MSSHWSCAVSWHQAAGGSQHRDMRHAHQRTHGMVTLVNMGTGATAAQRTLQDRFPTLAHSQPSLLSKLLRLCNLLRL